MVLIDDFDGDDADLSYDAVERAEQLEYRRECARDNEIDRQLAEDKEYRSGLHDVGFASDAWCESVNLVRISSNPTGGLFVPPVRLATNFTFWGGLTRAQYIPTAYRPWFFEGLLRRGRTVPWRIL